MEPRAPGDRTQPEDGRSETARDRFCSEYLDHCRAQATPNAATAAAAAGRRMEWTVAIDLTTTQRLGDGVSGAERQFAELRALAAETRNSPVEFVVQEAREVRQPGETAEAALAAGTTSDTSASARHSAQYQLDRYIIRNGQIEPLPSQPSQGIRADLDSLLHIAGDNSNSHRIGLIMQSHGAGPAGLQSDAGSMSLPELQATVRSGLSRSGHERLDFLDFDACSMSAANVANSMRTTSDALVASAETEHSFGSADQQNLVAIGREFIHNPSASGLDMASSTVRLARDGANTDTQPGETNGRSGTPDLEAIDLQAQSTFVRDLDSFGSALSQARERGNNRAVIDDLIHHSHLYNADGAPRRASAVGNQQRDLQMFATEVRRAIGDGRLSDPDGSLNTVALHLLDSHHSVVRQHFGETIDNLDQMGGVSISLPDASARDYHTKATARLPLGDLRNALTSEKFSSFAFRNSLSQDVQKVADTMQSEGDAGLARRFSAIAESLSNCSDAASHAEQIRALRALLDETEAAPAYAARIEQNVQQIRERERLRRQQQEIAEAPGWNRFIDSLYSN